MSVELNLVIEQGADFSTIITVAEDDGTPKDLTDYTFDAAIRRTYSSTTSYALTVEADDPPTLGVIRLSMLAEDTNDLRAPRRYVYDVYMKAPDTGVDPDIVVGTRTRVVEGIVTVTPSVSRPVVPTP
jgi:hypothetical protein